MEISTNFVIGLLLIAFLVVLFSRVDISMSSDNSINTTPTQSRSTGIRHPRRLNRPNNNNNNGSNNKIVDNDFISDSLREQLKAMEEKFYYDNCRFKPNF